MGPALPAFKPMMGPALPAFRPMMGPALPAFRPMMGRALPAFRPMMGPTLPAFRPIMEAHDGHGMQASPCAASPRFQVQLESIVQALLRPRQLCVAVHQLLAVLQLGVQQGGREGAVQAV